MYIDITLRRVMLPLVSSYPCFMQLLNFAGTWSYAGSLSRLFSLTHIKFLSIIAGLPLILTVMLRLFGKTIY